MRNAFVHALVALAGRDERIVLLTGDLGFGVVEPFAQRFPERFYNVGVAEQNMVGLATGLAEAGLIPYVYSIGTFASLRPYEFIRNGPALHGLPVRIAAIGAGFDYGHNGVTHYPLEDIAIMRAQPGMTVVVPADDDQARAAVDATASHPAPIYFRIGRTGPTVPGLEGRFELGRASLAQLGGRVAFIAIGSPARTALAAAEQVRAMGVSASVTVVSSFNPSPDDDVAIAIAHADLAVTVEAHYITGGLGSYVAEVIAERGLDVRLARCGVREMPSGPTGSQSFMEARHGLTPEAIAGTALDRLGRVRIAASR